MFKNTLLAVAMATGIAAQAGAEITADPIPADSIARISNIDSVSLSSEGDIVVAVVAAPGSDNEETALATWNLANPSAPPVVTPSNDRMSIEQAVALKQDRILVFARQEWTGQLGGCGEGRTTGATATFVWKTYLTDSEHSDFDEAFARGGRSLGVSQSTQRCFEIAGTTSLVSDLPLEPNNVIIERLNTQSLSSSYYRYNLATDEAELLLRAGGRTSVALFDRRNGDVLVRTELEPVSGELDYRRLFYIRNDQTGEFEVHDALTTNVRDRYTVGVAGRDEQTGQYYVLTDQFSDKVQVYAYDPVSRSYSDGPVLAHPDFNISGLIRGQHEGNFNDVLGFRYQGADSEIYWIDPAMQQVQQILDDQFDRPVDIMDWTEGFGTVLFSVEGSDQPPIYYILKDNRLTLLGQSRPWIDAEDLPETELVYYPARDGLEIPGLLSLPAGWEPEDGPLPTIIHPHGGPWARDYAGWDASGWVPFLTSRGYAVLRPQYRGSTGWGRELELAGDAQWGLSMQDDKDDGAAWLVEQGIADPDRIAIFGYSYGGFAAIAAVVRENSPYQCAIAGAGVSNLGRIGGNWGENRVQRAIQGWTVDGMDPSENTQRANIPILLFHGDRDVRVPLFHSTDFYNAVRNRVHAEMLVVEDMPHSLPWYPRHHRTFLPEVDRFLQEDCGPGGL
jgi:dipeptidyl aminopeptidase/acylaminoacyl peptidase